jgi:hypothetical protein
LKLTRGINVEQQRGVNFESFDVEVRQRASQGELAAHRAPFEDW